MEKVKGGARQGAGRKSKAQEQGLIEKLTPLEPLAFKALKEAVSDGKDWAVKLFFQYKFGMPKQIVTQTNINIEEKDLDSKEIQRIKDELKNEY